MYEFRFPALTKFVFVLFLLSYLTFNVAKVYIYQYFRSFNQVVYARTLAGKYLWLSHVHLQFVVICSLFVLVGLHRDCYCLQTLWISCVTLYMFDNTKTDIENRYNKLTFNLFLSSVIVVLNILLFIDISTHQHLP